MATARERVLEAAVELFAAQGYSATSVSQVIERAGLTKGGFYHHFASKDQLLYEIYGDLIGRQLGAMEEILARQLSRAETLRLLILDLVESTARSASQALVFWRELHHLGDERTAEYRRERRRFHEAVQRLIADGQRAGEFGTAASAETVTFTIFGVINELPIWYRPTGRKRPAQIAAELADFVLTGLEINRG
ncbi:TetR/AcrR family transcriptional regulator [Jatrophihabitans sp.]|uniref:TetR/AcrR family transcriptional regulator n=1 Tax=Jatrophihabitans sp. TaxID=1932789 RepID=UPI0030C74563|nr:TetR family transcriptional regulator [Jatrophihabitans sp.]